MSFSDAASQLKEDRERLVVRLSSIIGRMAGREDVTLAAVWNPEPIPGQPQAPAWFNPKTLTVTINAKVALGNVDPATINPLTPAGRRAAPVLIGLMSHEAAHARHTRWDADFGQGIPREVVQSAILLEEPRIELRQIARRPMDRPYLRAQSKVLDFDALRKGEAGERTDRWRAAQAAIMVLARVDAGVLEPRDARVVEDVLRTHLGNDLDTLRNVWTDVLHLEDGDSWSLLEAAQRWVDILGQPPDEMLLMGCLTDVPGGATVPGEDEWADLGEGSTVNKDGGKDSLVESLKKVAAQAEEEATLEIEAANVVREIGQQASQKALDAKKQRQSDAAMQEEAKKAVADVLGKQGSDSGTGRSGLIETRRPTDEERRLARDIAAILKRAQFRERHATIRPSEMPPGRFDGRSAMTASAQRSLGIPVTAKSYRTKVHKHVPEPPITLGIMGDMSGSMMWAEGVMSTITWAFAQAMTKINGSCASVAFGTHVIPITRRGQLPALVTHIPATDPYEQFAKGFATLDGSLNLTMGLGVRVLVVVSDGEFGTTQAAARDEIVERMVRNGGHVLWFTDSFTNARHIPKLAQRIDINWRGGGARNGKPGMLSSALADIPAAITEALARGVRQA